MNSQSIKDLVEGTADAAFAVDAGGLVSAWNPGAVLLFGLKPDEAIGLPCYEILQGTDESGISCSEHCSIQRSLEIKRPVANFDLQVQTSRGRQWCNVSILIVTDSSKSRHAIHIVHERENRKRIEQVLREFLISQSELTPDAATRLLSSARVVTTNVKLTLREVEILRLLANGATTKAIAHRLCIAEKTTNNHIANILAKLNAHSRLEAVRRAEKAGLI